MSAPKTPTIYCGPVHSDGQCVKCYGRDIYRMPTEHIGERLAQPGESGETAQRR